jgi:citrate/tricarballylate utilization protein
MRADDLIRHGQHVMTVCNACRYCEAYCPVFQAMEDRLTFTTRDLTYLANLCHNCGECLYACQYAPPHEFGIDVPRTLARLRLVSYQEHCWPRPLSIAFAYPTLATIVCAAAGLVAMTALARRVSGEAAAGDFYQVIPHGTMVGVFAAVAIVAVAAIAFARARFFANEKPKRGNRDDRPSVSNSRLRLRAAVHGLYDAGTLKYLHGAGEDCTDAADQRSPWRRRLHHCTFYGFALCFASTTVAAIYHVVFGWRAPYALTSVPVVLGTAGGIGLLVGPAGLLALRSSRDQALSDVSQHGLDLSFLVLLFTTSLTGLVLLVVRGSALMPAALVVHLAAVLALFLTLPYGKFVHGIYRTAALIRFAAERQERA